MLIFLFFGLIIAWIYLKNRPVKILKNIPPWVELIIVGAILGLFLHGIKQVLLNQDSSNVEGFEDIKDVNAATVSQALADDTEHTKIIVNLFKKYQELLKKYTDLKGSSALDSTECKNQLAATQNKLDIALKTHQKYRERLPAVISQYLNNNYISKSKVQEYITKRCNFNEYDITKHPDFQARCADPNNFPISKHNDYNRVTDEYIRAAKKNTAVLWKDFKVEDHPDFTKVCRDECRKADFFDIKKHESYQEQQDYSQYDITKHPDFKIKCLPPTSLNDYNVTQHEKFDPECQKRIDIQVTDIKTKMLSGDITKYPNFRASCMTECNKPEFYPITGRNEYTTLQTDLTQLEGDKNTLMATNKSLEEKNVSLSQENSKLKENLGKKLDDFKVNTVKDCPDLAQLLKTVKEQL